MRQVQANMTSNAASAPAVEPAAKRQKTGDANESIEDPVLETNIKKLADHNAKLQKSIEDESEEHRAVVNKWELSRRPLYEERQKLIENIPHFWQRALEAHPIICTWCDAFWVTRLIAL